MDQAQEGQTVASESEPAAADSRSDRQMPPELKAKLTTLVESFRNVGYSAHVTRLGELCSHMEKRQLPFSAQMFMLEHCVYSMDEAVTKSHDLVRAAKAGTRLEFSVQCLEDFVESCRECQDSYDYPGAVTMSLEGHRSTPAVPESSPIREATLCRGESGGSGSDQCGKRTSACTDPSEFSQESGPVPKPRRSSLRTSKEAGIMISPHGDSTWRQQQKNPRPRKGSSGSGGAKKPNSFLQLLLYPEMAKRKDAAVKKTKNSQTKPNA